METVRAAGAHRWSEAVHARLWALGSLVLVALCLLPTLRFGLLDWDDGVHVSANRAVIEPSAVGLREWLLTPQLGYPIPVTVASYALDHALFGLSSLGFHGSQVVYQLLVCALYLGLSRRLGLSPAASALALLVFALHPASAEPVSWVSGRKDVLAALFGLAAMHLALARSTWPRVFAVIGYALALLSKPSAAPLAVFGVVLPFVFAERRVHLAARTLLLPALPYALVLLPIVLLGVHGQASVGAVAAADDQLGGARAVWYALGHQLSVLFLWEETTAKYLPAVWPPGFVARVDLAPLLAAMLLALAGLATRARPELRRVVLLGAAWAGLTYLPSSGVFFRLSRFLADSYLFLPLLGVGWIGGAVFDSLRQRHPGATFTASFACAFALVPLFLASSARFADDESLWSHAFARSPNHRRVCRQWANAVARMRGADAGLQATDACIARFGPELFLRNRVTLLRRLGRDAEADAWLETLPETRLETLPETRPETRRETTRAE